MIDLPPMSRQPAPEKQRSARRIAGSLVCLGAALVAARAAGSAPLTPGGALGPDARARVAVEVLAPERQQRRDSARDFPGDSWSAGDAFHNREHWLVRNIAAREGVAIESVLDAIDEGLRMRRVPGNFGGAPLCKPRPFYD